MPLKVAIHRIAVLTTALMALPASAIMGGRGVDPDIPQSPWAGVVVVLRDTPGTFSGAMLDHRHVLTAAHVVNRYREEPERLSIRIHLGHEQSVDLPVEAIFVHPDFETGRTPANSRHGWNDDLAVIRLARPAPANVPTYPLLPVVPARHDIFTLVGYGASGDPASGVIHKKADPGVRRTGRNRVEDFLLDDEGSGQQEVLIFDFDGPSAASNVFKPDVPENLSLGPEDEAQLATGDSGCPLFVEYEGSLHIAAVGTFNGATPLSCDQNTKLVPPPCSATRFGAIGGATLVAPALPWIKAILGGRLPAEMPARGQGREAGPNPLLPTP